MQSLVSDHTADLFKGSSSRVESIKPFLSNGRVTLPGRQHIEPIDDFFYYIDISN